MGKKEMQGEKNKKLSLPTHTHTNLSNEKWRKCLLICCYINIMTKCLEKKIKK